MLTILGDPVPKGRPRTVRHAGGSRTYTPPATVLAEHRIKTAWRVEYGRGVTHPKPKTLEVQLGFYCATRRRADIDNLAKTVLDALNGYAYDDDSQIIRLVVDVFRGCRVNARTHIEIHQHAAFR